MRALLIALAALAVSCSPPAQQTAETPEVAAPSPDASREAVLAVLTPAVSTEVGQPVLLQPGTVNVSDGWAYVDAQVRTPAGSEMDWTTTNLASRYEHGAMDTGGGVHALLRNENGDAWVVVEHVIAPTDVAWIGWTEAHGVPAGVIPN